MIFKGQIDEFIQLSELDNQHFQAINEKLSEGLTALWCLDFLEISVDGKKYFFEKDDILFLTEYHEVVIEKMTRVRLLKFNRAFYCIADHDSEVGCKGILFYGASQFPAIHISENELEKLETLWKMFSIEMNSKDDLQNEMLQMMLKRFLILCTRIYKEQNNLISFDKNQLNLIREYNYLVESNFKTKHQVADYAALLHKSPKTLANVFRKMSKKTPLQVIHDRIILEARRLLTYSEKSIKEITYEIGYEDIQTFSRFFKKIEGISPSEFKKSHLREE